jgi:glycosyltransferase involved in cell wall biosynthesis
MNIWIVTSYEPLPLDGPNVRHMRCGMLAEAILERGHEVTFWASDFDHISHSRFHIPEVNNCQWPKTDIQLLHGCGYSHDVSPKRFFHNRGLARHFSEMANRANKIPDIIYTQVPAMELAEAVVNYGKKIKRPVIVDIRDLWPDVYEQALPKWLRGAAPYLLYTEYRRIKRILYNSTGVTAVSKTYLQWALNHAKRDIRETDGVFHLGFDLRPNINEEYLNSRQMKYRTKLGIDDNSMIITYVGTFAKERNIDSILNVAQKLAERAVSNIFFVIAGKGRDEEKVCHAVDRLPNVIYPGWLQFEELIELLSASDAGILPYSGVALMSLPNKPFEYMAMGLPLLNALSGELWEIVNEEAIGVNYSPDDNDALYEAVTWLSQNPGLRKQMGERAKALYDSEFRSDKVYPNFAEHLENTARNANTDLT